MKTRTIGQCKNCKYYEKEYEYCEYNYSPMWDTKANFGCWYWKEKKGNK